MSGRNQNEEHMHTKHIQLWQHMEFNNEQISECAANEFRRFTLLTMFFHPYCTHKICSSSLTQKPRKAHK
jgi:hypothetical protein